MVDLTEIQTAYYMVAATGVLVAGKGYWLLLPFAAFYGAVYYAVMKAEEGELAQRYGDEYLQYASRVPIFLPRWPTGQSGAARGNGVTPEFSWPRVIRNGEHRTIGGLLLIAAFLILKAKWFAESITWPHL